jgi:8-oxo-dGTP pyrophosphatase MutT (NUDIX family)
MDEGSGIILFDLRGRVLLQQRDDRVPPAGYGRWAIPAGRREGSESPRDTALREFTEETGVFLARLRFFRTFDRSPELPLRPERLHLFFADDDVPQEAIACYEGLQMRYWSPAEVAALPMNPATRSLLEVFLASDQYEGTLALQAPFKVGVAVLALDRWGRVLLQLRDADLPPERYPDMWSFPGGVLKPGEPPDAGVLREFEEETGLLLQSLKLFRVYRRDTNLPTSLTDVFHIYYVDADVDEDAIEVNEGQAFRYFRPDELPSLPIPEHSRIVLDEFLASAAYRAMFH